MIKSFTDYNLPKEYETQLHAYYNDVREILGPKLKMFMLFGSCSLGGCIPEWSDLDILVVVDRIDFTLARRLQRAQQKYDIKIALSVISLYELDNRRVDGKIKVALYLLGEGLLAPNYVNVSTGIFMVPSLSLEEVQADDVYMLPEYLHKLKRALCVPEENKRTIIKLLYLVMKIKLRSPGHEIVVTSYRDACEHFANEFDAPEVCFEAEIKNAGALSDKFLDYAKEIVSKICNGEI